MLVNLDSVLKKAKKEHYAVGLFNTTDTDMLEAAISAAEEMHSPMQSQKCGCFFREIKRTENLRKCEIK